MAAARAAAMETARMALAPSRDLVGVPSREIILWSSARWSAASRPATDLAISLLALSTALSTPLPRYFDLSPSRSSRASRSEEHTSELQSPDHLVCRLLLEKKKRHISVYYRETSRTVRN